MVAPPACLLYLDHDWFGSSALSLDCPIGSYKDFKGWAAACTQCPKFATTASQASTHPSACKCLDGYTGQPELLQDCQRKWININ